MEAGDPKATGISCLAAFGWALAGILFAAGCNTAFQAYALAATTGWQGKSRQSCRTGSGLAVGFGNDFVAHLEFQRNLKYEPDI